MANYIEIESVSDGIPANLVRQDLKFKTGKFVWRVKFNIPLNPKTVNNVNLYVTDAEQTPLKTSIHYDVENNMIEIEPLEAYAKESSYFLNITKNIESKGGQKLKKEIRIQFKV
jgi:hypothetical protein